eukprot:5625198-Amphidinium_carterae.1
MACDNVLLADPSSMNGVTAQHACDLRSLHVRIGTHQKGCIDLTAPTTQLRVITRIVRRRSHLNPYGQSHSVLLEEQITDQPLPGCTA